jgi:AraC-like DNA-binding protein
MSDIKSYNSLSELYNDESVGKQFEQTSDFTIHPLEHAHPDPVQSPVFRANYYSFVLIANGHSEYTIDHHKFSTQPNTLYFTNPGHLKSFKLTEGVEGFLITVSEGYLKQNIHNAIFDEFDFLLTEVVPPCYLSKERFDEIHLLCKNMLNENSKDSLLKDKIISSTFVVLLLKIKEFLLSDQSFNLEYNRESEIVKTFQKDLETNFRNLTRNIDKQLLRVQDFAEKQHLHPNYFSTVIKTKTGRSANQIIQKKLLSEAKVMLSRSSHSIKEVAYSLGFSEPTYFTKFFKKQTGMTPAAYRKSL